MDEDVPSPIDLRDPRDVAAWVAAADRTPWRVELRDAFAELLRSTAPRPTRVLELGAGPGLLAETILRACQPESYVLFDFSMPMLELSRERVGGYPSASFVLGDFKSPGWSGPLQRPFDAVVAMQAVHEIRHKRHVPGLYREARSLLRAGGLLIVCDHNPLDASASAAALYATEAEQHSAFAAAGFVQVRTALALRGMYLCLGVNPAER